MTWHDHRRLPELLAPAGSLSHLKAAINAGADAVYIGGEKFGARAYAGNFSGQDIAEGLSYAHFYDKKVYLTVNTLMREDEIRNELCSFLDPFIKAGLHGVIVQDLGTASFIHRTFPDLPVHASTQMTITSHYGAVLAAKAGMTRVVPARELSFSEIEEIRRISGLEVEVFIHGALCVCYSGQCLMSAMKGGRSGNRGCCAQPCRLPYTACARDRRISDKNKKYLLSPADLCGLPHLPRLCDMGIDSLKIEGRMKNPVYVAGVTAIYRKYLDHLSDYTGEDGLLHPDPEDMADLEELYCRSAFTDGYFTRHNGSVMMSPVSPKNTGHRIGRVKSIRPGQIRASLDEEVTPGDLLVVRKKDGGETVLTVPKSISQSGGRKSQKEIFLQAADYRSILPGSPVWRRRKEKLVRKIEDNYLKHRKKLPVDVRVILKKDREAAAIVKCGRHTISCRGQEVKESVKRPLTVADLEKEFRKTGNVPFEVRRFDADLEEGLFLPLSALKSLRRNAFDQLETVCSKPGNTLEKKEIELSAPDLSENAVTSFHVTVYDSRQLEVCLSEPGITVISLPRDFISDRDLKDLCQKIHEAGKRAVLILERVLRQKKKDEDVGLFAAGFDAVMVHNLNQLEYMASVYPSMDLLAGSSLYQWNDQTKISLAGMYGSLAGMEAPLEFSQKELAMWPKVLYNSSGRQVSQELLVYGRFPVMVTAQCIKAGLNRCDHRPEELSLRQEKGDSYPVTTHCRWCYNTIWSQNARRLSGREISELYGHYQLFRIDLFGLDTEEVRAVFHDYL